MYVYRPQPQPPSSSASASVLASPSAPANSLKSEETRKSWIFQILLTNVGHPGKSRGIPQGQTKRPQGQKERPKLKEYQLYVFGGVESRPVYVFGLVTQAKSKLPKTLKRGVSAIVMKRFYQGDDNSPINFVFCPYLKCDKGARALDEAACACANFKFHGDKKKMQGALTFPKNWFGQGQGKPFPNLATGWLRSRYKFLCADCK